MLAMIGKYGMAKKDYDGCSMSASQNERLGECMEREGLGTRKDNNDAH